MNTDNLVLALATFTGLTTKGTALTTEFDENLINIYKDFLAKAEAGGLDAYDNAATYELTQAVTYNGRTWVYVNAVPADGITPGSDITYWVEIDPTVLIHRRNSDTKLAEFTANEVSAAQIKSFLTATGEIEVSVTFNKADLQDAYAPYTDALDVITPSAGKAVVFSRAPQVTMDDDGTPFTFASGEYFKLVNQDTADTFAVMSQTGDAAITTTGRTFTMSTFNEYEVLPDGVVRLLSTALIGGGVPASSMTLRIWYREI